MFCGLSSGLGNSKSTEKRTSTCYVAQYSCFPRTKDREKRGKAANDSFRNKTEITLGLLAEMGATHSRGNGNTVKQERKQQQGRIKNEKKETSGV